MARNASLPRVSGILSATESTPFAAGPQKKIAVKVIDDRGNELMVVKDLREAE